MSFIKILFEPAILIISGCFIFFLFIVISDYTRVKFNLLEVLKQLKSINKNELSYRFPKLDEFMTNNSYTHIMWEDFKKALIFPEKLYIASHNQKSAVDSPSDIYLTIDASYFFNEESLISSKINSKFIQAVPTILTGLGPFFTFLKMAIAFSAISFSLDVNVADSLNGLLHNIRIAALCSVFAVGFSLTFLVVDKILYNNMCRNHCLEIQKEFIRLFDVVTSEKFLIDLVKESKIQNLNVEKLLKAQPDSFAKAMVSSFGETTVPYLENILYSLNKICESLDKNRGSDGDVVDKLF